MRTGDLFQNIPETLANQRYQMQAVVGSGGGGTVYTAIDTSNGELVAIKLFEAPLLEATSTERAKRFKAEAVVLASIPFSPRSFSKRRRPIPTSATRRLERWPLRWPLRRIEFGSKPGRPK